MLMQGLRFTEHRRLSVCLSIMILHAFCGCKEPVIDSGLLMKQERYLDRINRQFGSEGAFAGLYGKPDGTRAMVVRVGKTSFGSADLPMLENLSMIQEFDATGTGLGDEVMDYLLHWPELKTVVLSQCPITDAGAAKLTQLKGLRKLVLDGTNVTVDAIGRIKSSLPRCEVVLNAP